MEIVYAAIDEIEAGADFETALQNAAIKLNLIDNIHEIYTYGEQIKEGIQNKDYNAAAEVAGHILSIALDFQVNL